MKVSSDACLFGAYVPVAAAQRILDIGAGTGLLALMVAQRASPMARIDAIEIDPKAAQTAERNVAASPFANQIRVICGAIQEYRTEKQGRGEPPEALEGYDFIISNPPFYQNSLRSPVFHRNLAWHADPEGLDFKSLLKAVDALLSPEGVFWVLLPAAQAPLLIHLAHAEYRLFEQERLEIRQRPDREPYRIVSCLSRRPIPCRREVLIRCEEDGSVSGQERQLMGDYMLHDQH